MTEIARDCLGCGSKRLVRVRRYRSESAAGRRLFAGASLLRCGICGVVQVEPVPTSSALEDYYAEAYRTGGRHGAGVADVKHFPRDNMYFMYRGQSIASLIAEHLPARASVPLRILDVGAGFGHLLHALGERFPGSSRSAIEISQVCVDHLRTLGVTVHQALTESVLAGLTEEYDIIALSHVLEHLRDPAGVLALLRDRLAANGVLYVEVPHIPPDSLTRYIDHAWAPRHDEPHITFFSPSSLRKLLEGAGLAVWMLDAAGPEYADVNWAAFHIPPPKTVLLRLVPDAIKRVLRQRGIGRGISVFDHEGPFYRYGGRGIWLRSLSSVSPARDGDDGFTGSPQVP